MRAELDGWRRSFGQMVQLCAAGQLDAANTVRVQDSRRQYFAMKAGAQSLVAINKRLMEQSAQRAEQLRSTRTAASWALMVLSIAVAMALFWLTRRSMAELQRMAGSLLESSQQAAQAAGQLSAGSQTLAQGASEQTATLEETSASTEEINSMVRANADHAREAAETVKRSGHKFESANKLLDEMVHAMEGVNSSSEKVSRINKAIEEIAFQTNILALNAAVEAARAGEAGMGFAVVADEVRMLAHRSAQAAKDTAELIEEAIRNAREGSLRVDGVATAIREVTRDSASVVTLVNDIHAGSEQQAEGVSRIAQAIHQMETVTQSNAASAEESAAAAEELTHQAKSVGDLVSHLRELVGGTGNRAA